MSWLNRAAAKSSGLQAKLAGITWSVRDRGFVKLVPKGPANTRGAL